MQHCCIYKILYLKLCMDKPNKYSPALDDWGIRASLLCSIHCALMPILILSSVMVGWQVEQLERLESPLFLIAAIIGLLSIFQTYFNQKKIRPVLLLMIGLILILTGGIVHTLWLETSLRVSGSLFIVFAHHTNKRVTKQSA